MMKSPWYKQGTRFRVFAVAALIFIALAFLGGLFSTSNGGSSPLSAFEGTTVSAAERLGLFPGWVQSVRARQLPPAPPPPPPFSMEPFDPGKKESGLSKIGRDRRLWDSAIGDPDYPQVFPRPRPEPDGNEEKE